MSEVSRIDRRLNLVVPIDGPNEAPVAYVHAMPISLEVFEANAIILARTYSAIFESGVGGMGGTRIAAIMLRKQAEELGVWSGQQGVERGLMNEIRRLSNFVGPDPNSTNGWGCVPYHDAVQRELLSSSERSEVENALCFFTLVSSMQRKKTLQVSLAGMTLYWDASATYLDCMEFANSIRILTTDEGSGEKTAASSVPI